MRKTGYLQIRDLCDVAQEGEDKKNMEVVADQNEGFEYDEGIEPTQEEIEAAKALVEQEA